MQTQGNGTPRVTVQAPYKSFSFTSFWFASTLPSGQAVAGQATQCTVTVAGFVTGSNQEVAVASYTFTPALCGDRLDLHGLSETAGIVLENSEGDHRSGRPADTDFVCQSCGLLLE